MTRLLEVVKRNKPETFIIFWIIASLFLLGYFFWKPTIWKTNDEFYKSVGHFQDDVNINTSTKAIEIHLSNFKKCGDKGFCFPGIIKFSGLNIPIKLTITSYDKLPGVDLFTKEVVLNNSDQTFTINGDELKSIKNKLLPDKIYSPYAFFIVQMHTNPYLNADGSYTKGLKGKDLLSIIP